MAAFGWYLLGALPVISGLFLGGWLTQSLGKSVGWYLQRKTSARRKLIQARVNAEEEASHLSRGQTTAIDEADWEKVESYAAGSAANGGQAEKEWEGVVGFFHPFWYVHWDA